MSTVDSRVREHFADLAQQGHAARLGIWLFLASEALLFSALFALFAGYRVTYPEEFRAAAGETSFGLGIGMTFILLTSSFLMAESVERVRAGRYRMASWLLGGVVVLGILFLGLKATEWGHHIAAGILPGPSYHLEELPARGAKVFFTLYYLMTGVHIVHLLGGVIAVGAVLVMNRRRRFTPAYHPQLELTGLYWQFVDIVWLFLWAIFYLER